MLVRPVLRLLEQRAGTSAGTEVRRRDLGFGLEGEYLPAELLSRRMYLHGMHEHLNSSVFVAQVTAGSTVVDVGANVGEYSLLASRAVGPMGRVISIEPNPDARTRMRRHLDLNHIDNVELLEFAAGAVPGVGLLKVPDDIALGSLRDDAVGTALPVDIRTIDSVLTRSEFGRVSAMKIDVEGWENDVVRGAEQSLSRDMPVVMYECWASAFFRSGSRFVTDATVFLESIGYRHFLPRPTRHGWQLVPVEEVARPLDLREPWSTLMYIAVHRANLGAATLQGRSGLPKCGVFELLGR